jgi:hypothetical protein
MKLKYFITLTSAAEGEAAKPADEDEDGMKKMRKDFFANMSR